MILAVIKRMSPYLLLPGLVLLYPVAVALVLAETGWQPASSTLDAVYILPPVLLRGALVLVSGGCGDPGQPGRGCPYQDAWFRLFEFPALSLLDLVVPAA